MIVKVKAAGSGWVESPSLTPIGGKALQKTGRREQGSVSWSGGRRNGRYETVRKERDTAMCVMLKCETAHNMCGNVLTTYCTIIMM